MENCFDGHDSVVWVVVGIMGWIVCHFGFKFANFLNFPHPPTPNLNEFNSQRCDGHPLIWKGVMWSHQRLEGNQMGFPDPCCHQSRSKANGFGYLDSNQPRKKRTSVLWVVGGQAKHCPSLVHNVFVSWLVFYPPHLAEPPFKSYQSPASHFKHVKMAEDLSTVWHRDNQGFLHVANLLLTPRTSNWQACVRIWAVCCK